MTARFATRRQRALLWAWSDGRCARCGCEVDQSFHADHRDVPWSVGQRTDIGDLQILCAACNIAKGKSMLRKHQREAVEIANDPLFGSSIKKVLMDVTPGGGKSVLPIIFGKRLIEKGLVDKLCWVLPRDNLRTQSERTFLDPEFRNLLGHKLEIRAASNEPRPSRDLNGYATTYQAIASCPELHISQFALLRYMLVLDEVHHIALGGEWHRALQALVERAACVILLSGTLSRDDGNRIAFVDYKLNSEGMLVPDIESNEKCAVVRYTRKNALSEKAVLPLIFERVNGSARWKDNDGYDESVESLADAGKRSSAALHTAIHLPSYYNAVLGGMMEHWKSYRVAHPRSKFLVVANGIALAKMYVMAIRRLGILDVDIATSDESDAAKINIERLQGRAGVGPELSGLVTVGMAYEGMDCPALTHLACLTKIRSHEWLEQMLARITRVDYKSRTPYAEQRAFCWAPDDQAFSDAIAKIKEEQIEAIEDAEDSPETDPVNIDSDDDYPEPIIPLEASATETRVEDIQSDDELGHAEAERYRRMARDAGLPSFSPVQMKQLEAFMLSRQPEKAETVPVETGPAEHIATASERENALRQTLDRLIKQKAKGVAEIIKAINRRLIARFNVPRNSMTISQLEEAVTLVGSITEPT